MCTLLKIFLGDPLAYLFIKTFKLLSRIKIFFCSEYIYFFAKLKGISIGKGLLCWGIPYLVRYPYSKIIIGNNFKVNSSFKSNNIGINARSRITTNEKYAEIIIGENVGISGTVISAFNKISIGDNTLIGGNVLITDSDWHTVDPDFRFDGARTKTAEVEIGRNVFIGTRSIVLKGVRIGDNSVIGAGSVVVKDIPENVIAAGNPCVVIKKIK